MYGEPAPRDPRIALGTGVLPLFWIGGLALAFVCSVTVALGTLFLAATSGVSDLERRGIVAPDELLLAVHDHSPARDGSAGCVVTGPRLVRWDAGAATASVELRGATVSADAAGVHAVNGGARVDCPFADEDPEPFARVARRWTGR